MSTKIQWTNETWNPIVGCSKVSPGCDNCYAERMAGRLANMYQTQYQNVTTHKGVMHITSTASQFQKWNGKTAFVESALEKPLHWKKPRRIFVCSMGDFWHKSVPQGWQHRVLEIVRRCPQHIFQFLTKRPENALKMDWKCAKNNADYSKLPNLWLGVTAENQEMADKRIPDLLKCPAAKRFVSVEPMLGKIDLRLNHWVCTNCGDWTDDVYLTDNNHCDCDIYVEERWKNELDWVICGGESGPNARPMHPDWARSLRDQCKEAGVPFFFKQWGEWCYPEQMPLNTYEYVDKRENLAGHGDYNKPWKVGKKKAGRLLDGVEHNEFPESDGE